MRLPRFLRKLLVTEGLKLTIFTYKWGKCVKLVGKYLLESLIKQGFPPTSKISHFKLL